MNTLITELNKRNKAISETSCKLNNAIEEYRKIYNDIDIYSENISVETDRKINHLFSTILESIVLLKHYHSKLVSFIEGAKAVDSNLQFRFNPLCKHLDDIENYTGDKYFDTAVMVEMSGNGERNYYDCYGNNSISEIAELVNT